MDWSREMSLAGCVSGILGEFVAESRCCHSGRFVMRSGWRDGPERNVSLASLWWSGALLVGLVDDNLRPLFVKSWAGQLGFVRSNLQSHLQEGLW